MSHTGILIEGKWRDGYVRQDVTDKYTEEVIGAVELSTPEQVADATRVAIEAMGSGIPVQSRIDLLEGTAAILDNQRAELAEIVCRETGKVLRDAQGEVSRAIDLLRVCVQETVRLHGEVLAPLPGKEGRVGMRIYEPIGVVAAIAPFNGPLILMVHKVGPAIAAGNAVIGKPAVETPLSAVVLFDALRQAAIDLGLPPGLVGLLQGGGDVGMPLVSDENVSLVTFTGGAKTGESITRAAGLRPTVLELGGNSAAIVCQDADLDRVCEMAVSQGYQHAGQVCISLQRLYVHADIYDNLIERLVERVNQLVVGDPRQPETDVGPLLRSSDAERIEEWVDSSVAGGARVLTGARREGRFYWPTLLADVNESDKIVAEEIFGPVVTVLPFTHEADVVSRVDSGRYGLQAGVFTSNIERAFRLARSLKMRSVLINNGPGFREDTWPYGGRKASGHGTEGPHWAIREMSVEKLLVLNQ